VNAATDNREAPILRSVLMLFSGTVLAQAIPFLAAPVFARLFDAPEFALFGAAMAVFNVLNVLATGRYEMAVLAPEDHRSASDLVRGAMMIAVGAGSAAYALLFLFHGALEQRTGLPALGPVVGVIGALTTMAGIQLTLQQWLLRGKAFTAIAQLKVLQALAITAFTLVLGWTGHHHGLVFGYAAGWSLFTVATVLVVLLARPLEGAWDLGRMGSVLMRYRDWPLHNAWPALLNAVGSGLAVMYMTLYFDTEIAGQHNFARQYILTPIGMVTVALGQVLFVRTTDKVRDKQAVGPELKQVFKVLLLAGLLVALVLVFAGPFLFRLVFGGTWEFAGQASRVLMAGYVAQLLFSPFGVVLLALRRVKDTMIFPVVYVALMGLPLLFRSLSPLSFMGLLSMIEVVAYVALGLIVRHAVLRHDRSLSTTTSGIGA
jgi:O-antigen/teichoic acid export membrane protein